MVRPASLTLAALMLAAAPAFAQKACSKADEAAASKAIDRVSSWASLQATWKTYKHCDKGEVGDNFTEALLRLIIDWKNIEQLASGMKDAEYEDFVLSHLRSEAAKGDAEDVYSRAKTKCPSSLASWCSNLASAVRDEAPKPITFDIAPAAPAAPAAPTTPPPATKK